MNERVWYALGGAVVGSVAGYLIADWLLYKYNGEMLSPSEEVFLGGDKEAPVHTTDDLVQDIKRDNNRVDYTAPQKEKLEDLVKEREYSSDDAPVIISIHDWIAGAPDLSKVYITFYVDDSTFASENEEIISAPQNLFGPNIHLQFGQDSDDPDVVYVANRGLGAMYEISRRYGSYKGMVLGEPEKKDDPPPPVKRKKRAVKKEDESTD